MNAKTPTTNDQAPVRPCDGPRTICEGPPSAGIRTPFLSLRTAALGALIVAVCVGMGASGAHAQSASEDLSGRWTSPRHGYVVDVTRCGGDWCGVKVNADASCGPVVMRLAPDAKSAGRRDFVGTLHLDPAAQTYQVRATVMPADTARPIEINLLGNPNVPPLPMTRMILFQDRLVRGTEPKCSSDGKLS